MHKISEYVKSLRIKHDSIGSGPCISHSKYKTLEMLYFQYTDQ